MPDSTSGVNLDENFYHLFPQIILLQDHATYTIVKHFHLISFDSRPINKDSRQEVFYLSCDKFANAAVYGTDIDTVIK
jgi:hypothetical protein